MPSGDLPLAIGYWLVSHKSTLKKWWAIGLLAVIFLAALWVITSLTVFFTQENRISGRIADSATMLRAYSPRFLGEPKVLTTGDVAIVRRDSERADLVGFIDNANEEWGATAVRYHFTADQYVSPTATTVVNPGENRPVVAANQRIAAAITAALVIESTEWVHGQPPLGSGQFQVLEKNWSPAQVKIGSNTVSTITLQATLRNVSVYNYYKVSVPVIVRSGEEIVAVDELTLDRWSSRTNKSISLSWPYGVSGATDVDFYPTVDQYNATNRY